MILKFVILCFYIDFIFSANFIKYQKMTLLNAINYIDLEYMGQPLCGEAKQ